MGSLAEWHVLKNKTAEVRMRYRRREERQPNQENKSMIEVDSAVRIICSKCLNYAKKKLVLKN